MFKNRLLDRPAAEAQWRTLHHAWVKVDTTDDQKLWRKTCNLFDVFIEEVGTNKFEFDITDPNGNQIYAQNLTSASTSDAMCESDELIWEFIATGVELLAGITLTRDRPPNEVRFKSMVLQHNILHGLDEDGVLYREEEINDPSVHGRKKKVWARVSMERYKPMY